MALHVCLVKIPVTNLAASVAFYEKALGVTVAFASDEYGWAQLEGAGFPLALYVPGKGGGTRSPGGSLDVHLAHEEVDALAEQVRTVASDAKVHVNDDGSRSLEFTDPDGNVVKIMQS